MVESPRLASQPAKVPSAIAWAARGMRGAVIATSLALVVYVVIGLISWAAVRGYFRGSASAPRWASPLASSCGDRGPDPPGSLAAGWGQLSPGTPPCRRERCSRRLTMQWALAGTAYGGVVRPPRGGPFRGRPRRALLVRACHRVGVRPCGYRRRRAAHRIKDPTRIDDDDRPERRGFREESETR